jgi:hypothetical protein
MIHEHDEDEERIKMFIDFMIELGALEIVGYDQKSDSFTYSITKKMKDLIPEFFEEHKKFINQIAFNLWNEGHVEIKFEEDGPLVMLKEGVDYKSLLDTLKDEERMFLENMLNYDNGGII